MINTNTQEKSVWDIAIRLIHWLMVSLFGVLWWTADNAEMDYHRYAGYALLAILVFRVYWGFVGSNTARFSYFVTSPTTIWQYSLRLFKRQTKPSFGHNPLGGVSAILLLVLMLVQVGLGLFAVDVDGWEAGPLNTYVSFETGRWCAQWHETVFNLLLVFSGLHIVAVLYYLVWRKQNLIMPMISGRSRALTEVSQNLQKASFLHYIIGIVLAVLSIWWFI